MDVSVCSGLRQKYREKGTLFLTASEKSIFSVFEEICKKMFGYYLFL